MTNRRFRPPMKAFAAFVAVACFLTFGQGAVSTALAADPPSGSSTWETWPKKPEGAGAAGEAGGAKTASGISAGTWGWILGGVAAAVLIAVAASGGGGGSTAAPAH